MMGTESRGGGGGGEGGKFFPSSGQPKHGGNIPSKYFMQSDACRRCHADIYKQWDSSMHHFSSFNNQWYRKSSENMQEDAGVRSSIRWAGSHEPTQLYSGLFRKPAKQINDRPQAHAGLASVACD